MVFFASWTFSMWFFKPFRLLDISTSWTTSFLWLWSKDVPSYPILQAPQPPIPQQEPWTGQFGPRPPRPFPLKILQRKLRRDWRTVDSVPLKKITALLDSSPPQRFFCWRMYVLPRCQCDQGSSCHHWTPRSHLRTPLCYSQTSLGMLLWSLPSWYGTCPSMAMTFMCKTDFSNKCASIYMDFKRTLHDL